MSLITKIADLAIAIANDIKGINSTVSTFDGRVTALESASGGGGGGASEFDSITAGPLSPKIAFALIETPPIPTINASTSSSLYQIIQIPASINPADIIALQFSIFVETFNVLPDSVQAGQDIIHPSERFDYKVDSRHWDKNRYYFCFSSSANGLTGGIGRLLVTYRVP